MGKIIKITSLIEIPTGLCYIERRKRDKHRPKGYPMDEVIPKESIRDWIPGGSESSMNWDEIFKELSEGSLRERKGE